MESSLILLTGGGSRRLGQDKATVNLGGQRLVDLLLAQVPTQVPVIIVGPALHGLHRAVRVVREEPPGSGPLAGIGSGVAASGTELVAVLAVDMPFAMATVAEALHRLSARADRDAVLPTNPQGYPQLLCGAYRAAALRTALNAVGPLADRAVKTLLPGLDYDTWPVPASDLADVDTADELARARSRVITEFSVRRP